MEYLSMKQNQLIHRKKQHSKQKNITYIALLHFKVPIRPATQNEKTPNLTASFRRSITPDEPNSFQTEHTTT